MRYRHRPAHDHQREQRHGHHQEASHRGYVLVDAFNAGPVGQRYAPACERIGLTGEAVHGEAMNENVDRTPRRQIEEPSKVALERGYARLREQQ